jgi:hypothetical protein
MIVALLFLILSAILFPGALRLLFALMLIGGIMILGEVHAGPMATASCGDTLKAWGVILERERLCISSYMDHPSADLHIIDDDVKVCLQKYDDTTAVPIINEGKKNFGVAITPPNYFRCNKPLPIYGDASILTLAPIQPQSPPDAYSLDQMYSGPLGAHIGPGPHVMAPYTGW